MKRLLIGVMLFGMALLVGCGESSDADVQETQSSTSKAAKKASMPKREKVSDKEAVDLLLAQTREWMEISGLPKSTINEKMFVIEADVSDNENNLSTVAMGLRKGMTDQGLEPCVSEKNEVMHIKTEHERVVFEYAKNRNVIGSDRAQMIFAFRALSEDEQEEAAAKLEKMMK